MMFNFILQIFSEEIKRLIAGKGVRAWMDIRPEHVFCACSAAADGALEANLVGDLVPDVEQRRKHRDVEQAGQVDDARDLRLDDEVEVAIERHRAVHVDVADRRVEADVIDVERLAGAGRVGGALDLE